MQAGGSPASPGWGAMDVRRACTLVSGSDSAHFFASAAFTRFEHPVYALLSLSGFYCSFHLAALPLRSEHPDDLIHLVFQIQISFIFRPNNRINS